MVMLNRGWCGCGVLPVLLSVMDCKVEILCFDETDSTKMSILTEIACSVHALNIMYCFI